MEIPYFVRDGKLTTEGEAVKQWFEEQIKPAYNGATRDAGMMNSLSGHVKFYLLNVKLGAKEARMTPERFLEEFRHKAAFTAWQEVLALKESQKVSEQVQEQGGQLSELTEALEALRAELKEAQDKIAELEKPAAKKVKDKKTSKPDVEADNSDEDDNEADDAADSED